MSPNQRQIVYEESHIRLSSGLHIFTYVHTNLGIHVYFNEQALLTHMCM